MGIKKTLKHLRQLAEVSQENQETAHNMIWRIERQLSPASPFDAMKEAVQDTALAFGGKRVSQRPLTLYNMVKDTYERARNSFDPELMEMVRGIRERQHLEANVQSRTHNQMHEKLNGIITRLDTKGPPADELASMANNVAKIRADLNTANDRLKAMAHDQRARHQALIELAGPNTTKEPELVHTPYPMLTTINQRLDFITDAIGELRAEMHALAKPTKVYASKGTTETLATIEEKVELLADHLSKLDDRLVEGGIINIS